MQVESYETLTACIYAEGLIPNCAAYNSIASFLLLASTASLVSLLPVNHTSYIFIYLELNCLYLVRRKLLLNLT